VWLALRLGRPEASIFSLKDEPELR
jgi:hypothetical protein